MLALEVVAAFLWMKNYLGFVNQRNLRKAQRMNYGAKGFHVLFSLRASVNSSVKMVGFE